MIDVHPDSIEGVCEVTETRGPGVPAGRVPHLLIELPHGATRESHYHALRRRLRSELPADLIDFFFVNTDVGSPECARELARMLADPAACEELTELLRGPGDRDAARMRPRSVTILRSLVPRTFIDCNRALDGENPGAAGLTPVLPEYITHPDDVALLTSLHRRYHEAARQAYARVCGSGGVALTLHTYAPRTVGITRVDGDIVRALHEAYEPERHERWPLRPEVDVISGTTDGTRPAPAETVRRIRELYARIGIDAGDSESYRLDPSTMGYRYSTAWPGRVVCVEIRRDLLAEPFDPFAEMTIGERKTRRMALPLAAALTLALE